MLKLQFCRNTMEHMDLRRHFSKVVQVRVYIIETVPKVRSTTEGPRNANQGLRSRPSKGWCHRPSKCLDPGRGSLSDFTTLRPKDRKISARVVGLHGALRRGAPGEALQLKA